MKRIANLLLFCSIIFSALAQRPIESSADIYQEIKKLNVLTNVLYLAAHPDDENTRLIAWLENEKLARTAYLSLTRGSGGQNLIGTEKGPAMGVLRTQELIEARKIDGGEQYFSSAVDFGYSKTAEETLEKWDKEEILSDVVWTIRKFRPDVIITRFPPDSRAGHGHHTASAMLAEEGFKIANDPKQFSEQSKYLMENFESFDVVSYKEVPVEPWQAKRILWNTSVWWDQQLPEKAAKAEDYITINIGDYNEVLGLSYSEIASDSRSQHKSQGFGSSRTRGNKLEYLKHTAGEQAKKDLFEGINTTWSRVDGSQDIQNKLNQIIENYAFDAPAKSLKDLVELYQMMDPLKENFYVAEKRENLRKIIKAVAGIHVEALAERSFYVATSEEEIQGTFKIINRSEMLPIQFLRFYPADSSFESTELKFNEEHSTSFSVSHFKEISQPYWLYKEYDIGYKDQVTPMSYNMQYGDAENHAVTYVRYELQIGDIPIIFEEDIDYKWTDRVDGELHADVEIHPAITANVKEKVYLFANSNSQNIDVVVENHGSAIESQIELIAPEGWQVEPKSIPIAFENRAQQKSVQFKLTPPKKSSVGEIKFKVGGLWSRAMIRINYDHIKPQLMFPPTSAKVVRTDIQKSVNRIGYIIGSGDEVAQNLTQVGFNITSFRADELPLMDLDQFDCIMVGIRAYNTQSSLQSGNAILNEFVKNGGNVIVQYNTSRGLKSKDIGPFPLTLGRSRVTKEEATPTLLNAKHGIFNSPNKITEEDFNGWVQERGLYFASEWDEAFEPLIAWNDPGEDPQKGSLLVADYGEGHFIYTGISFFRQLPAGVPGAFRLMSNLISYGKE